jgi:formiminoglutamase
MQRFLQEDTLCGIEIDLDCIENTLSSAITPAGFSPLHARQYVSFAAASAKPAYLHICEGATRLSNGKNGRNYRQADQLSCQ